MGEVLRYDDPEAVDHPLYGRYATITAGAPGRCPECEEFGYIDGADLVQRLQDQHCRACSVRWSYAFHDDGSIAEVRGLREVAPASQRIPDAVLDLRAPQQTATSDRITAPG